MLHATRFVWAESCPAVLRENESVLLILITRRGMHVPDCLLRQEACQSPPPRPRIGTTKPPDKGAQSGIIPKELTVLPSGIGPTVRGTAGELRGFLVEMVQASISTGVSTLLGELPHRRYKHPRYKNLNNVNQALLHNAEVPRPSCLQSNSS
jgi:hypothetical protein